MDEELLEASREGRLDEAERLLAEGANPNAARGDDTPLSLAAFGGHRSLAQLLISKGANVAWRDSMNTTAVDEAVRGGKLALAEYLKFQLAHHERDTAQALAEEKQRRRDEFNQRKARFQKTVDDKVRWQRGERKVQLAHRLVEQKRQEELRQDESERQRTQRIRHHYDVAARRQHILGCEARHFGAKVEKTSKKHRNADECQASHEKHAQDTRVQSFDQRVSLGSLEAGTLDLSTIDSSDLPEWERRRTAMTSGLNAKEERRQRTVGERRQLMRETSRSHLNNVHQRRQRANHWRLQSEHSRVEQLDSQYAERDEKLSSFMLSRSAATLPLPSPSGCSCSLATSHSLSGLPPAAGAGATAPTTTAPTACGGRDLGIRRPSTPATPASLGRSAGYSADLGSPGGLRSNSFRDLPKQLIKFATRRGQLQALQPPALPEEVVGAIARGDAAALTKMLDEDLTDATLLGTDHRGQSALHLASWAGSLPCVRALLASESGLQRGDRSSWLEWVDERGRTALHTAVLAGHAAVTEALLLRGARADVQDLAQGTPLLYATKLNRGRGDEQLISLLEYALQRQQPSAVQ